MKSLIFDSEMGWLLMKLLALFGLFTIVVFISAAALLYVTKKITDHGR